MQPKDLGKRIRNIRLTKKLTQEELAARLYITPQTISKWERGMSYPDVFRLKETCDILGVSIGEMLGEESTNSEKDYFIAIDGGGTKTEFVLFEACGRVISSLTLGTSNPNACGKDASLEILTTGIDQLLETGKNPKRLFAGISGVSLGNYIGALSSALKKTYPALKVTVNTDIMNVLGLVRDNSKCIAGILGTGSVVYGWDGTMLKRVGGWGYLIGDPGSGYDIGKRVLRACYEYDDGLTPQSEIVRLAEIKLGGPATKFTDKIYNSDRSYIASFCPLAFEAMVAGDKMAEKIITASAHSFAELINHLHKTGSYGNHVAISGSIATHNKDMRTAISSALNSEIKIDFPTLPPIFGAMRRCVEAEYGTFNFDEFEKKFKSSYIKS